MPPQIAHRRETKLLELRQRYPRYRDKSLHRLADHLLELDGIRHDIDDVPLTDADAEEHLQAMTEQSVDSEDREQRLLALCQTMAEQVNRQGRRYARSRA